jgi:hypothetical protein
MHSDIENGSAHETPQSAPRLAYFSNIIAVQRCFEPGYFSSLLVRHR